MRSGVSAQHDEHVERISRVHSRECLCSAHHDDEHRDGREPSAREQKQQREEQRGPDVSSVHHVLQGGVVQRRELRPVEVGEKVIVVPGSAGNEVPVGPVANGMDGFWLLQLLDGDFPNQRAASANILGSNIGADEQGGEILHKRSARPGCGEAHEERDASDRSERGREH